jgi:hypothetical protein
MTETSAKKAPKLARDISLDGCGSFSTKLGRGHLIESQEFYLYFSGTWRGQAVRFTQQVRRYRYAGQTSSEIGRLSDWMHYVTEARALDPERNGGRGDDLTTTARHALGEVSDGLVDEFLAGGEFTRMEAVSIGRAIQGYGRETYQPWATIRAALKVHAGHLPDDSANALLALADTLEAADEAMRAVSDTLTGGFNSYSWTASE